jgi:hypothetical protein
MWNPFAKKPTPATIDTVTLAYHREAIDTLNAEVIRLRAERNNARSARDAAEQRVARLQHVGKVKGQLADELLTERDAARGILREIDAMLTPSTASIGRRMAAKAREGLLEFATGAPVREVA